MVAHTSSQSGQSGATSREWNEDISIPLLRDSVPDDLMVEAWSGHQLWGRGVIVIDPGGLLPNLGPRICPLTVLGLKDDLEEENRQRSEAMLSLEVLHVPWERQNVLVLDIVGAEKLPGSPGRSGTFESCDPFVRCVVKSQVRAVTSKSHGSLDPGWNESVSLPLNPATDHLVALEVWNGAQLSPGRYHVASDDPSRLIGRAFLVLDSENKLPHKGPCRLPLLHPNGFELVGAEGNGAMLSVRVLATPWGHREGEVASDQGAVRRKGRSEGSSGDGGVLQGMDIWTLKQIIRNEVLDEEKAWRSNRARASPTLSSMKSEESAVASHPFKISFEANDGERPNPSEKPSSPRPPALKRTLSQCSEESEGDYFGDDLGEVWERNAENAYGAFLHVAMTRSLFEAITVCGPMVLASVTIQAVFSMELAIFLDPITEPEQAEYTCNVPSDLQFTAIMVYLILMLNNVPGMMNATNIALLSMGYKVREAVSNDQSVRYALNFCDNVALGVL